MTTDITELAQSHELLIANGQQTAELLRHLADNEIDSDYFAVVSESESYGKETDAELSITEFAHRAAGYVDALVEALEKAQRANGHLREQSAEWERKAISNFEDCAELSARIQELESQRQLAFTASNRWADKFREAEKRIAELEESNAQVIQSRDHYKRMTEEGLKQLAESRTVTVKLPKRCVGEVMHMSGFSRDYAEGWCSGNDNAIHEMRVAGIKVEGE